MFSINKNTHTPRKESARAMMSSHRKTITQPSKFEMEAALRPTNTAGLHTGSFPVSLDMSPTLSGFMFNREEKHLVDIYKDIYYYDVVAGTAVDLLSFLPFSEFSLRGLATPAMERPFLESLERLNIHTLLPEISVDYLVFGTFIGSLIFNPDKKIFVDSIPQDFQHCSVTTLPFYGVDPIISVDLPKSTLDALNSKNLRVQQVIKNYGAKLINKLLTGKLELDPLSTIYLPRRTMTCSEGTSYFRRILPIYFLEKNIFRGTLVESIKRQRAILHLTVGDYDWEPSSEDLKYISELFINADNDPLGAIVATRSGVSTNDVRCLSGTSVVVTPEGEKNLGELVACSLDTPDHTCFNIENLQVLNHENNFVPVECIWYEGVQATYGIELEDGTHIVATANHQFLCLDTNPSLTFKALYEINLGDWLLRPTVTPTSLPFAEQCFTSEKDLRLLQYLKNAAFAYIKIVSLRSRFKEPVYDVTIKSSHPPIFVVNSICSHNSGGDFWQIESLWSSTVPAKLKALNISEDFINGAASVSTMEASMSGFVEQLRSYRAMLTRKLFYNKLFPLISLTNEFYVDDKAKAVAEELKSKAGRNADLSTLLYQIQDTSSLIIPELDWEKNLKPEGDQNYIEILKAMTEAGIPVPIRAMAAAGGIKIDKLLKQTEDDLAIRKKLKEYTDQVAQFSPPSGGDESYSGFAAALAASYDQLPESVQKAYLESLPYRSTVYNNNGKPNFLRGSESFEVTATTKTGKPKVVHNQKLANDTANDTICRALDQMQQDGKLL